MVALIPARAGSKRLPGKNMKLLAGHPLIAYTIAAAQQSGVFGTILVCSDDGEALAIGADMGVLTRPRDPSPDDEPDIVWVRPVLHGIRAMEHDSFAILRPTSPFRTAATIQRAHAVFQSLAPVMHSLRAVQPVREHPGKMWHVIRGTEGVYLAPILEHRYSADGTPWHSLPTQAIPGEFVRQNASLEMARSAIVASNHTISGWRIAPFFTEGHEGHDLNTEDDWTEAEKLLECGAATLPSLR